MYKSLSLSLYIYIYIYHSIVPSRAAPTATGALRRPAAGDVQGSSGPLL